MYAPTPSPWWYCWHGAAELVALNSGILAVASLTIHLVWPRAWGVGYLPFIALVVFIPAVTFWLVTRAPAKTLDAAESRAYHTRRAAYLATRNTGVR
jgi:hypothetical protein